MAGMGQRPIAGGAWVGQPQPEEPNEYVPPIPDDPTPEASAPAISWRRNRSTRIVVIVAFIAIAVFAILLLAPIL
jgi:hypothetical protein